jgi:hypothetical protein
MEKKINKGNIVFFIVYLDPDGIDLRKDLKSSSSIVIQKQAILQLEGRSDGSPLQVCYSFMEHGRTIMSGIMECSSPIYPGKLRCRCVDSVVNHEQVSG